MLLFIALRELHALAIKQFVCPGDSGWPLGTLFPQPASKAEGGLLFWLHSATGASSADIVSTLYVMQISLNLISSKLEMSLALDSLVFYSKMVLRANGGR